MSLMWKLCPWRFVGSKEENNLLVELDLLSGSTKHVFDITWICPFFHITPASKSMWGEERKEREKREEGEKREKWKERKEGADVSTNTEVRLPFWHLCATKPIGVKFNKKHVETVEVLTNSRSFSKKIGAPQHHWHFMYEILAGWLRRSLRKRRKKRRRRGFWLWTFTKACRSEMTSVSFRHPDPNAMRSIQSCFNDIYI